MPIVASQNEAHSIEFVKAQNIFEQKQLELSMAQTEHHKLHAQALASFSRERGYKIDEMPTDAIVKKRDVVERRIGEIEKEIAAAQANLFALQQKYNIIAISSSQK